jgi:hypothetical protein
MRLPREEPQVRPSDLFGEIPAAVVGGVATRAYAPERHTRDIDFLVAHECYEEAIRRLLILEWSKVNDLLFPNTSLRLYGSAWEKDDLSIDVIATDQAWADEALRIEAVDQTGLRIVALPYLVLMKLDSARGIDQGDLTRMLGRLNESELERVVRVVERYSHDPQAGDDVRPYFLLGRIEWEQPKTGDNDGRR